MAQQGKAQFSTQVLDLATYTIVLNSGVTAGTVTFQACLNDQATWYNLPTPAPVSLVFATAATYNGQINGPYHGLRCVVTALAGGTINAIELLSGVRSL